MIVRIGAKVFEEIVAFLLLCPMFISVLLILLFRPLGRDLFSVIFALIYPIRCLLWLPISWYFQNQAFRNGGLSGLWEMVEEYSSALGILNEDPPNNSRGISITDYRKLPRFWL